MVFFGVAMRLEPHEGWLTSWRGNHWQMPTLSGARAPAAAGDCQAPPLFAQLQEENLRLERSFPAHHSLQGRWLHWDLAKLPFAQARLLSHLPESAFRPQADQLKSCADVECLYNTMSGDAEKTYGALAWQWFLKTGVALSWNGPEDSFSKEELHQLLDLTHLLGQEFFHQHLLTRVEKAALKEGTCVEAIPHRISAIDTCVEARDAVVRVSRACPDVKTLVTAGMSELLLPHWVKQFPDWQTRLLGTPRSMSEEIRLEDKRDQWTWRDVKNRHLKDCLDLHKTALTERPTWRGIASLSTPHPLAQCLRATAVDQFLQQKRQALSQSKRACDWLAPSPEGTVPIDAYLSRWEKLVNKDIDQLEWRLRSGGVSWLREYQTREAVLAKLDPTWVYFECHQSVDPKSCYQQGFSHLLTQQERVPASVKDELLEDYPFEALEARVRQDVGVKRQWMLAALEQAASRAWQQCWRQGPNAMVKPGSSEWLAGHKEQVDGRFAHCLEAASPQILGALAPGEQPEARYWRQEMRVPLVHWWAREVSQSAEVERQWLWQQKEAILQALTKDLTQQSRKIASFDAKAQCPTRLTYHYPARLYFHNAQQLNGYLAEKLCLEALAKIP